MFSYIWKRFFSFFYLQFTFLLRFTNTLHQKFSSSTVVSRTFQTKVFTLFRWIHYYLYLIFKFSRLDILFIQEKHRLSSVKYQQFRRLTLWFLFWLWENEMNRNFFRFLDNEALLGSVNEAQVLGYANLAPSPTPGPHTQVHRSNSSKLHFRAVTFHSISFPVDFHGHSICLSISFSQD
jgi:hypothetical protein